MSCPTPPAPPADEAPHVYASDGAPVGGVPFRPGAHIVAKFDPPRRLYATPEDLNGYAAKPDSQAAPDTLAQAVERDPDVVEAAILVVCKAWNSCGPTTATSYSRVPNGWRVRLTDLSLPDWPGVEGIVTVRADAREVLRQATAERGYAKGQEARAKVDAVRAAEVDEVLTRRETDLAAKLRPKPSASIFSNMSIPYASDWPAVERSLLAPWLAFAQAVRLPALIEAACQRWRSLHPEARVSWDRRGTYCVTAWLSLGALEAPMILAPSDEWQQVAVSLHETWQSLCAQRVEQEGQARR